METPNNQSPMASFAQGCCMAIIEVATTGQPLTFLKNWFQDNKPIQDLPKDPKLWYGGFMGHAACMVPVTATQKGAEAVFEKIFNNKGEMTFNEKFLCSALAGYAASFIANPTELYVYNRGRGMSKDQFLKTVIQKNGYRAFFKGQPSTGVRDMIFGSSYMTVAPECSHYMQEHYNFSEEKAELASSMGVGVITSYLSHPFDMIKTRMYSGLLDPSKPQNFKAAALEIIKKEGYKGLWKGGAIRALRVAGALWTYNKVDTAFRA